MKYSKVILLSLFIWTLAACKNKTEQQNNPSLNRTTDKPFSPIEGNWILVSNEVYGKQVKPKRYPQQFKMFNDGFFSYLMYDSAGHFYNAGAGHYEVNGNMYKETFTFFSDTIYIGSKDWQRWEMKGDTLFFYGFEKAESVDGKDVTQDWGKGKFVEKRVRAIK